ncbi:MAG TPA: hypothetical protein VM261_18560 [Kofleriaceae bacterium]|nr:hypothetical protein [Kofleriaceae bacterium]
MKRCTQIADSLISGEPLSDGDRDHVATCAGCQKLTSTARLLTNVATATEAGPGFTSRMIAGARERLEARRRQRVVGFGLATCVAAAAAALIVMSSRADDKHQPDTTARNALPGAYTGNPPPADDTGEEITDDELRELVDGAGMYRAITPTTNWADIESPLTNYRAVLRLGGEP